MKRGRTRKSRHSRRRSTRRMRGGEVAPRPNNTIFTKAKRVFSFGTPNTVARRLNNRRPNVRLGSVYSASTAKQYLEKEQPSVIELLQLLNQALQSEIQTYRPGFIVEEVKVRNTMNVLDKKYDFTEEEKNQMRSKKMDASQFEINPETLKTAIAGVKNVMKFYKETPNKTFFQKLKNKAFGLKQEELNSLSEKIKKTMGVDKDTIDSLLAKLESKNMTFTEAHALLNTITMVILDLQETIEEQAGISQQEGGGKILNTVLKISGKIVYFVYAVFVSGLAGVAYGAIAAGAASWTGPGAIITGAIGGAIGFAVMLSYMYGKPLSKGNAYQASSAVSF